MELTRITFSSLWVHRFHSINYAKAHHKFVGSWLSCIILDFFPLVSNCLFFFRIERRNNTIIFLRSCNPFYVLPIGWNLFHSFQRFLIIWISRIWGLLQTCHPVTFHSFLGQVHNFMDLVSSCFFICAPAKWEWNIKKLRLHEVIGDNPCIPKMVLIWSSHQK